MCVLYRPKKWADNNVQKNEQNSGPGQPAKKSSVRSVAKDLGVSVGTVSSNLAIADAYVDATEANLKGEETGEAPPGVDDS